jgi:hypothetical protein
MRLIVPLVGAICRSPGELAGIGRVICRRVSSHTIRASRQQGGGPVPQRESVNE